MQLVAHPSISFSRYREEEVTTSHIHFQKLHNGAVFVERKREKMRVSFLWNPICPVVFP
jgi:hypothetical protein